MINHSKKNGRNYGQGFQLTFENGYLVPKSTATVLINLNLI